MPKSTIQNAYCRIVTNEELPQVITAIVSQCNYTGADAVMNENGEISW